MEKEEILPSERKIFNSIIDMAFKKNDELERINKDQALEIARLKRDKKRASEIIESYTTLNPMRVREKLLTILGQNEDEDRTGDDKE